MPGARAVTATGLSSFEAIEETLVRYYPAQDRFVPDGDFVNITERGEGAFRMSARYNAEWWDGDRDTQNKDRQRMEVKGLGPHQHHGDTFLYTTTWRSNPGFRGSSGFCHIFQLKAVNGDSGAPLVTLSIHGDKATVEANPAGPKIIAREFSWRPDTWQTVRIRIKVSPQPEGELLVSVDGDAFQGKRGVALARPEANEYRPKWGLYRRAAVGAPQLHDDYIEHREVSAQNLAEPAADNAALERAARAHVKGKSPRIALEELRAQPASPARDFAIASVAVLWAETQPREAMAWADALPASAASLRADAIGRIFARWADRDVGAAAAWLRTRAPSRELDPVAWLFVTDTTYRYVNRGVALEAAPLIADPELRAHAFAHVLEIWARTERAAALAFLEKTPALTAEQKAALAKKLPPPRGPRAAEKGN